MGLRSEKDFIELGEDIVNDLQCLKHWRDDKNSTYINHETKGYSVGTYNGELKIKIWRYEFDQDEFPRPLRKQLRAGYFNIKKKLEKMNAANEKLNRIKEVRLAVDLLTNFKFAKVELDGNVEEIERWLEDECSERVYWARSRYNTLMKVWFESEEDRLLFILKWIDN